MSQPIRAALAALAVVAATSLTAGALALEPGTTLSFAGQDQAGQRRASQDYRGKVLVVVFWGSDCHASASYAARLTALAGRFPAEKVAFLGVASNGGETAERVAKVRAEQGLPFPILVDADQSVRTVFQAGVTPTAYVLDGEGRVRYLGAIDDDPRGDSPTRSEFLRLAVEAVLAGRAPDPATTPMRGVRIR